MRLLRYRLDVYVAKLDRTSFALQADRPETGIGVRPLVLKQAVDIERYRLAVADDVVRIPLARRFFI